MDELNGRDEVFSEKIRAGKRTYFFDVRATRANDYYITITESKRKFNRNGYDKHKIFLYKEDFNKFQASLLKTIDHVKTELMPDYDYEEFDRKPDFEDQPRTNQKPQYEMAHANDQKEEDELSTAWED
ncbi:MAG: DUF3276 family protein [Bacteroidota bacterium]